MAEMAETSVQAEALDEILNNCLLGCQQQDWQALDTVFDLLVRTYQIDAKKIVLTESMIQKVAILFEAIDFLSLEDHMNFHYSIAANIFRLLRNCCAGSPVNVAILVRNRKFLDAIIRWLRFFSDQLGDVEDANELEVKMYAAVRCCLQFLANAVGGQCQIGDPMRRYVWSNLDLQFQRRLLNATCSGVRKISSAIIYNCLLDDIIFRNVAEDLDVLVILIDIIILELRGSNPSEWSYFILQRILEQQIAVGDVLRSISVDRNILFIEVMTNMVVQDNNEDRAPRISEYNLIPIFRLLQQKIIEFKVERTVQEKHPRHFDLIFALLRLACEVTANERNHYSFLEDGELFKLTSTVLHIIHQVHKKYTLRDAETADLPLSLLSTLQMKKHLVRLIANLSYNRTSIKNLANKLDTVPLILDLAHYDFHNPFIREWAILGLNNLLKNHPANQEIVRSVYNERFTNSFDFLHGLELKLEE